MTTINWEKPIEYYNEDCRFMYSARLLAKDFKNINYKDRSYLIAYDLGKAEVIKMVDENGCCESTKQEVFNKKVKKNGWINIYKFGDDILTGLFIFCNKNHAELESEDGVIATIKIEWEE
jgi:hypothetical protein